MSLDSGCVRGAVSNHNVVPACEQGVLDDHSIGLRHGDDGGKDRGPMPWGGIAADSVLIEVVLSGLVEVVLAVVIVILVQSDIVIIVFACTVNARQGFAQCG